MRRHTFAICLMLVGSACSPSATEGSSSATEDIPATATTAATSSPVATTVPTTAAVPVARMGHAMVGIGDGELLVFGGRSFAGSSELFLQDTWIFDAVDHEWTLVAETGPLLRSQHAMAYDPSRDEVLVFGGYVGSSFTYGDTWLFDVATTTWRRLEPAESPSARAGSVLAYDSAADIYVMFAGAEEPPAPELPLAETWKFDPGIGEWALLDTGVTPTLVSEGHPTLFELAMVYDSIAGRSVLLVAGESTWAFEASTAEWTRLDQGGTQQLGADYMTAAAFDQSAQRTVAYGGAPVGRTQSTWAYDYPANGWVEIPGATPGPIANHAMAYDPLTEATYLFGGAEAVLVLDGAAPVVNSMWVHDDEGWQRIGPGS
jgi:hypothetical protein